MGGNCSRAGDFRIHDLRHVASVGRRAAAGSRGTCWVICLVTMSERHAHLAQENIRGRSTEG